MNFKLENDPVNHPSHYNAGKIEVIEAIEDWGLGFHVGNTVKYSARAGKKDPSKEIEDLEKARWYLNRRIELLIASKEGREVVRPNDMNSQKEFELKKETDLPKIDRYAFIGEWLKHDDNQGVETILFCPQQQNELKKIFELLPTYLDGKLKGKSS